MSRRARHKAPHRCCAHLHDLKTAQGDIKLMSGIIEKINSDRSALENRIKKLQAELTGEEVTEELSVAQIRAHMRNTAPAVVPITDHRGFTMWLPVGKPKARRVRPVPTWSVQGGALA
jgi:hypothetical protein